uniref:helix-turn-helix domain-containing protein n=1 Tax=Pararhizobium sp. IMCC3301 TaxID=3067904 RepID=UPI0027412744|nr:helix-turn-helix transcriptional regulator [Pararhizobium sp. IMCC3301]
MIIPQQIRMARAGLRWTIDDLSRKSGVGSSTIKRLESVDDIVSANISTLFRIEACLEAAGIEFIGAPDDAPGIRIHPGKN